MADSDLLALAQRISEIDDTLTARGPNAFDEALLLVERKSAYELLYPLTIQGGDRRSAAFKDQTKPKTISFCSDTADKLGCSERIVQMKVSIGEALAPIADEVRASPIVDNGAALRSFAALDQIGRTSVLEIWAVEPKASFSAALIKARLRQKADSEAAAFDRMFGAWVRAGSKARRRFLDEIGVPEDGAKRVVAQWRKAGTK